MTDRQVVVGDSQELLNGSAYNKGVIALPSNCNQPEAASRMLSLSETTLPFLFLTTSSRHFVIFIYQSPSNPFPSIGPLSLPPSPPPLLPLLLSLVSV